MRIYVACLAAYNNGILHGAWIDANDAEDMTEATQAMLKKSPMPDAEEWAIHDYELPFKISEYESFESIAESVEWIESQHDEELAALVLSECQGDTSEAEKMMESYAGEFSSLRELGESRADDFLDIPSHLENYIDYEAYGRDMSYNMHSIQGESGTHYFYYY